MTKDNERKILTAFLIIVSYMVVEAVGGIVSGSLALLADAGHMMTDAIALGLAYVAFRLGRRRADGQRTFGYARFEVIAGLVNALTLFGIVGWILYEAFERFNDPRAIVFCDYKTAGRAIAAGAGYEHCYQFVWDGVTSWYTPNRPLARHKSAFVFMRDPKWDFDAAIYHDGKEREAKTVSNTRGISDYVPLDGGMVHLQTVFQMGNTRIDDGGHAHAKPLEWVRALMLGCGVRNGAVVLDQFAGSGSFTISAPGGVSVRSIELDPETCGRAVTRIAAATGCQPERI